MTAAAAVERVRAPSPGNFRLAASRGRPLVIHGVVDQWPIFRLTIADLKASFGELKVRPRVGDYVAAAFSLQRQHQETTLGEYLSMIEEENFEPPPYVGNHLMPAPSLCHWPDYFQHWETPRVWLGPGGTVTPLHCDYEDNLLAQIWGRKRVVLFSPACAELLYLKQFNEVLFGSPFDPEKPDYDAYPMARGAVAVECVLGPGEMLYLPAGWFHHVRALEFSLSINRWTLDEPASLAISKAI